jgi:predicted RNase H-like HicB family nuclease
MDERSLHVDVHYEDDAFWAQLTEWPECSAAGKTLDELVEGLCDAISLYVTPDDQEPAQVRLRIDTSKSAPGSECELRPMRPSLRAAGCRLRL